MFTSISRYANLETADYVTRDDRKIRYKRRRFLPQGDSKLSLTTLQVTRDDRLDLLTSETLGNPEQFWQLCDANNAMNPFDLLAEPVQELRIPQPTL